MTSSFVEKLQRSVAKIIARQEHLASSRMPVKLEFESDEFQKFIMF
jgi:hypothetical protein